MLALIGYQCHRAMKTFWCIFQTMKFLKSAIKFTLIATLEFWQFIYHYFHFHHLQVYFANTENGQTYFGVMAFAKILALFQMLNLTEKGCECIFPCNDSIRYLYFVYYIYQECKFLESLSIRKIIWFPFSIHIKCSFFFWNPHSHQYFPPAEPEILWKVFIYVSLSVFHIA